MKKQGFLCEITTFIDQVGDFRSQGVGQQIADRQGDEKQKSSRVHSFDIDRLLNHFSCLSLHNPLSTSLKQNFICLTSKDADI